MYAVVEVGGKQYTVEKDTKIVTEKLVGKAGDSIELDRVLMCVDGEDVKIGQPVVEGVVVKATIEDEFRGKKVIVFKKKRRKGYRVKNGHRQEQVALRINEISVS
ncbi:MAG: 50S ribosomal protein L21 [Calditrichaeota bacterium]|nr:MAG: 50S ribosomal protein L21 [Calditrichota bacterium]